MWGALCCPPDCSEHGEGMGAALLRAFALHHMCSSDQQLQTVAKIAHRGPPPHCMHSPQRAMSRGECCHGESCSGDTWQLCLGRGS